MLRTAAPSLRLSGRGRALPRWWAREQVVAPLLLLAAALLRLPLPDLSPFGHDEALEAIRARPIWDGARPVESEITSWFIPDPAGLLYLFALAEAFSRPAIARVELIAAVNVLAVLVCYALGRRFFGPRVGLAAGALYAVNPWAATFARQPWVITQPLLTCGMLFAAMMVVARRDRRWVVPFFFALAAQTQTHLLAVLYGPPVLLTLLLFPRRWLGRELLAGAAAALLIVAPYATHLWGMRDGILDALGRGERGLTLVPDPTPATLTLWLVSGLNLDLKLGLPAPMLEALRGPLLGVALLAGGLLLLGIALASRACLRRDDGWEADALLLIWFFAPLLLMSWQSSAVYIHYVLVLLPTPFLLMALAIAGQVESHPATADHPTCAPAGAVARTAPPSPPSSGGKGGPSRRRCCNTSREASSGYHRAGIVRGALLAAICAIQVAAVIAFYAALEASLAAPRSAVSPSQWQAALNRVELGAKQVGIGELHGLPLRYWQSVADRVKAAAPGPPDPRGGARDVVVITGIQDSGNRHLDERRKALEYLLGPDLRARFPLEGLTVVPTTVDTLFLTIPEQDLPRSFLRDARPLADVPLPGTNGTTRLWLVRARPARELARPRALSAAQFETGVRLLGLDAPPRADPGQTLALVSFWLVEREDASPDADDEPFIELIDATGASRAYQAGGGLPSHQWRAGDLLVQRASLTVPIDVPPGPSRLTAGLASRRDGARARLVDDRGRASGDAATVANVMIGAGP